VQILHNGHSYPPELPFPTGDLDLPCNTMLWAHASPQPKRHLDRFSRVCTNDRRMSIWFACFALKIVPSHVADDDAGIWTSCNTWFIEPTRVRNATGNLIVSAVFAGLTSVSETDRSTTLLRARRRNLIMRNYVGYGKTTQSFHVSTNNFATIKPLSVRSKHLTN